MDLNAAGAAARRAVYALLCVQASACTLQDFHALDRTWGLGGEGPDGQGGSTQDAGVTGGTAGEEPGGDSGAPDLSNLIQNPSFETGHAGWVGFGNSSIIDVATGAHSGDKCIESTNRSENWQGPSYPAVNVVTPGANYRMSGWVRMDAGQDTIKLTLKQTCDGTETYISIAAVPAGEDWVFLEGVLPIPDCVLSELTPYFEGPAAESAFHLDDVSLTLLP